MPVKKQPEKVYQLHILLKGSNPKIWRRFLVTEDITLAKLHEIIQKVMGWYNCHLHEFTIDQRLYGPAEDAEYENVIDESKIRLDSLKLTAKQSFQYTYDFGDSWEHKIKVEKILPFEPNVKYPKCLDGEKACPPEDCGGVWGYKHLLDLQKKPESELTEDELDQLKWYGDPDADYFSVDGINIVLWNRFAK